MSDRLSLAPLPFALQIYGQFRGRFKLPILQLKAKRAAADNPARPAYSPIE